MRRLCYVGLGSNMDVPKKQVQEAIDAFQQCEDFHVEAVSSLYQTKPVGVIAQDDFTNAVLSFTTDYEPLTLLAWLMQLEQKHHRQRLVKWGPRTLDCDLLLFGQEIINLPTLTIPHPEMKNRAFVLIPLAEIAPNLVFPTGERLQDLLQDCRLD